MTDERISGSEIYKRVSGGPKNPVKDIIGHSFICLLILGLVSLSGFGSPFELSRRMGIIAAVVAASVYAGFAIKDIKSRQRQRDKTLELLETMNAAELCELDSQLAKSECYFDTFHLLDEYLYVPSARLLIRYRDIRGFKTKIRRGGRPIRKVGARLELTDDEGLVYKLEVKDWNEYLMHELIFKDMLSEKTGLPAGI